MSKSKERKWSKHGRSHSSEQSGNLQSTFMDNRGWIEAVPSRSLDRKQRDSPKDMLGAVSDEDILKLTQLTAEVTTELKQPKTHRHRQEQEGNKKMPSSSSHTPESTDNESTRHSEKSSIKTSSIQKEDRRRSWLYKSILKPIKNKGKAKETNEDNVQKTPASAFIDEFYQKQQQQQQQQQQQLLQPQEGSSHKTNLSKLNTIQVVSPSPLNNSSLNRRHSFDSVQSLVKQPKPTRDSKLNKLLHPFPNHHHHHHHHHHQHQYQHHQKQIPTITPTSSTLNINSTTPNNSNHSNNTSDSNLTPTIARMDRNADSDNENKEEEVYQRPSFHLVVSHDSDGEEEVEEVEEGQGELVEEDASCTNASLELMVTENTVSDDESDTIDDQTTLMFDYDSLPPEVRGLIDEYDGRGKVMMKDMFVKDKEERKDDGDEEEDDNIRMEPSLATSEAQVQVEGLDKKELDIDESDKNQNGNNEQEKDEIVYSHQLISGGSIPNDNKKRKIAIVTTSKYDDIEFTKLIQLDDDTTNGPLIDIHVSLFEVNYDSDMEGGPKEEFQHMLESIEERISSLEYLKKESSDFLNDHQSYLRKLNLEEAEKKTISRTLSYPNLGDLATESISNYKDAGNNDEEHDFDGTTRSSTTTVKRRSHNTNTLRNARSMYIPDSSLHDPFEYKKYELNHLIDDLRQELKGFQSCLEDTEKLVNSVQLDIDDTRNRMETYIKDIPQSHYSALKTLEVDIDSILSKRAKNPWLDTGYTLLSYLLTLFALVVWVIIYLLKMGKKILFFPKNLWNSYSDYLLQRNRIVRNASLRSVSH